MTDEQRLKLYLELRDLAVAECDAENMVTYDMAARALEARIERKSGCQSTTFGAPPTEGGTKHDSEKVRLELLSSDALNSIAQVLTFGAKKYGDHNWRKGFAWSRLYGAAMRHLLAHMNGDDKDQETGMSHLAHAACCLMFLIEHETRGLGTDDRHKAKKDQA